MNLRHALLTALLLWPLSACTPQIGDACLTSQECNAGQLCDTSSPGGYCTLTPCEDSGCPEEATCVEFEGAQTWCVLRCEADDDCRDGYTCRDDLGPTSFCYIP
jgi:hypothetical protein